MGPRVSLADLSFLFSNLSGVLLDSADNILVYSRNNVKKEVL